jgi:uncharacterized protein YacL
MNLSFFIIRALLGIIFFALGVWLPRNVAAGPWPALLGNPYLLQSLVALLFGVFGVFAVPFLAENVRRWFESLITITVAKTLAPWTKQISKQMGKQIGKAVSRRKPKPSVPSSIFHLPSSVILDTSVIIDGRLLDILKSGFLDVPLVVPQFVLDELQHLADSGNDLKRQRGRRGLEILDEIKRDKEIDLTVKEDGRWKMEDGGDVDKQLIKIAKQLKAKIATVDYNLNKAASVSGIRVLNVNELANCLKTVVLPGEKLKIRVVQKGKEEGQGVGYLEDGTMVVIEEGDGLVGQQVEVEVSRVLQTAAGKMVFSKLQAN